MEVLETPNYLDQLHAFPIGETSKKIFDLREHALIGVSPFNSYFTEPNLIKLIGWALNSFKKVTIFIPDKISFYTLVALGYSKEKAEFKTRRQDNYLKNKVLRALQQLGITEDKSKEMLLTFSQLLNNPHYQEIYKDCLEKFTHDDIFRKNCILTTSWILTNNPKIKTLKQDYLDKAVQYFLYEFPLFLNTPRILNQRSSLFIYHTIPKYLETIYTNNIMVSQNQGYLKVCLDENESSILATSPICLSPQETSPPTPLPKRYYLAPIH